MAILLFIILIFLGSFLFSVIENWAFLDSLYFTVMSMLTIGYGDLYPKTDLGKISSVFVALIGILFIFYISFLLLKNYLNAKLGSQ
jgi:hypothetical protein